MRTFAKTLAVLLLLGAVCAAAPEERHRMFAPGTKITLKPRKAKYFLGENIVLDYHISYDGDGALAVDTITGLGSPDCTVIATDADGKKAAASTREFRATGQSGRFLRRGNSIHFTVPLSYYCRLEKPGKYRIRAAHNLGWTKTDATIAEDDPRWAEATIEVMMPDEAQAQKVVEQMLATKTDVLIYQQAFCTWNTEEYADFACLRYPVYLPILEKMVSDKEAGQPQLGIHASTRAVLGITHNPAPEAIQTLLRLAKSAAGETKLKVAGALCDRLPKPKDVRRLNRSNPLRQEDADPDLVRPSWREEFAIPMRQTARKWLGEDPEYLRAAAYILESISVPEDTPDLVAAVSRLVPIVERAKPPEYIGEVAPVRLAYVEVTYALATLTTRGGEPKANPKTSGEIIHFVTALKQRKDFRPDGWEKRCRDWVRNDSPCVREFVLFNTPRPLPDSLVGSYRDAARKVVATTREQTVIHLAVRNAVEFKVPVDELLATLVARLDSEEPQLYVQLMSCISNLLTTGRHDREFGQCIPVPEKDQLAAFKTRWNQFLGSHGKAIRDGKRFPVEGPEYRRLMHPDSEDDQ